MKTCYEVELGIKERDPPDTSGNGPFPPADSPEKGMKIMVYPEVLDNPAAVEIIVKQICQAYQRESFSV